MTPPRMSAAELALFKAFLSKSARYLEFGAGGSTVLASSHAKEWIVSVDSSREWLDRVAAECEEAPTRATLIFADIGRTGDWGFPVDPAAQARWSSYHADVWSLAPQCREADFVMVDGRFRVACFAQAVLHCSASVLIGIHDFASRPFYHVVHEIGREIAALEDMSVFAPRPGAHEAARRVLETYWDTPQ